MPEEVLTWADVRAAEIAEANRARIIAKGEPRRRGREQSAATRRRLKMLHLARERERAAQDPNASPLKIKRLEAGLSWLDLCTLANVSRTSVSRMEGPRWREVSDWTWRRVASVLACSVEEIKPDDCA